MCVPSDVEVEEPVPADAAASERDFRRRSLVLAIGWLATNLGLQLGTLPLQLVLKEELKTSAAMFAGFWAIGHFSNYMKPLAGVMTDSIPLCGTRRRHYLLFSLIATGVLWVVLALMPRQYQWMLVTYSVMYIGVVFTSTTLGGLMVEVGHQFRAAGRLTAQRIGMFKVAEVLGAPIGGFLSHLPFIIPAAVSAAFHLALAPFLMRFLPREPHATRDGAALAQFVRQGKVLVRSRTLLGAAGLVFLLAAAPGLNTPLLYFQRDDLHFNAEFIGLLKAIGAGGGLVGAALYFFACRRLDLKTIVAASIVIHALGALCYLGYKGPTSAIVISAISGLTGALAMLPVYDIAARATPRGSEAIGYAVMMSMWNITNAFSDVTGAKIYDLLNHDLTPLIWIDALTTLVALFAVPFMPRALTSKEQSADYGTDPAPAGEKSA